MSLCVSLSFSHSTCLSPSLQVHIISLSRYYLNLSQALSLILCNSPSSHSSSLLVTLFYPSCQISTEISTSAPFLFFRLFARVTSSSINDRQRRRVLQSIVFVVFVVVFAAVVIVVDFIVVVIFVVIVVFVAVVVVFAMMMNERSIIGENLTFRMIQVEEEPLMEPDKARIAATLAVITLILGTLIQVSHGFLLRGQ